MSNQLFNTEILKSKTIAMKDSLQKLVNAKNELAEFGIIVNEDCLLIDKKKHDAFWSDAINKNQTA